MAKKGAGTICIIDPDRELQTILAAAFASEGFRVVAVSRSRDAIAKLDLQRFAAIFLEPDLGDSRAEEVFLAATDANGLNASTPVVVMSGNSDAEIPKSALESVAAIVIKPFSLDQIVGTLREVTAQGAQQKP